MDVGRRSHWKIDFRIQKLLDRKPRPTRRRQKIWHTTIYRWNQHTPLQEAGKKEPQFPNGRVFACSDGFLLSSFRFPANNKQTRYDAICVQECLNFNTWGYGLRSKRFEGSRLYSKIMLAKQRNDGAPGSTEKKLGLPGSGQPPFGTLIYKLSYFAWDTCASVPFLRQRYTLRDTIDICKLFSAWAVTHTKHLQMKTMTLFWNYIFHKNGSFFPESIFLQTGQCLVVVYLLLLHNLHDFCRRINVLSRSIFPRSHGFVQWKPRKNR